jgi:hypothetical protein
VRIASNIGPTGGGFEYTLHQEPLIGYDDISAQRVDWGRKLTGSPRELLKPRPPLSCATFLLPANNHKKRSKRPPTPMATPGARSAGRS